MKDEVKAVVLAILAERLPGRNGFPKVQDEWLADAIADALLNADLIIAL